MKYIFPTALLCFVTACTPNAPKQEAQKKDSSTQVAPPLVSRVPERKINGSTIIARTEWREGQTTMLAAVSREYDRPRQYGGLKVECWQLGAAEPDLKWQYMDSLSCGKGDIVVSYNLGQLYTEDFNSDGARDVAVLYTLACAVHVIPQPRFLVVFDKNGKVIVKLGGKSLEPNATNTALDIQNMDLQPASKNEVDPVKTQGRIDNYKDLDKLPPAGKKRLIELWREGLAKDKRMNVFDQ